MQGTDPNSGALMQAFALSNNGNTEIVTSAGAVADFAASTQDGFYLFTSDVDVFLAVGTLSATIPVAGTPGGTPVLANNQFHYYLDKNDVVSVVGAAAFNCYMTKV